jgi:hypothetical protein
MKLLPAMLGMICLLTPGPMEAQTIVITRGAYDTRVVGWRGHEGQPALSLTRPHPVAACRHAQLAARSAVFAPSVEIAPSSLRGEGSALDESRSRRDL